MPTSHDSGADIIMPMTAVAAVTAGTLFVTATTLLAILPMTSALSGAAFSAKVAGRVNSVLKSTSTAFLSGAPLAINTALSAVAPSAGGIINAYAWGDANSSAATMDVLLCLPITD